ncbi:serine hydrolase domain-containing protein [Demetria terragena]|uniref:serine hydrolase domain-containing protein n=1 Tax=Demetria terragena TaxID=63959 RepID=UPI00036FA4EF|nr:serine hydrolase domain-containing protein [Demetria terragena]
MSQPTLFAETAHELALIAANHQRDHRVPGLLAAVAQSGKLLWHSGIGTADLEHPGVPHDPNTHVTVASNTKTFTAAMVMQLRDEGKLRLSDPIDQHLPDSHHDRVTIRHLLSHLTGVQREPVGDVWDTLEFPDRAGLIQGWNAAERILPEGAYWHYSNLGYAMLGELVARLDHREWAESLQERLLNPLGLKQTGLTGQGVQAGRYYVKPYTDVPVKEPLLSKAAIAPAGGLWSTATDMATWHGFLADPDSSVLSPDTVDEMCQPHGFADTEDWRIAYGLGLQLTNSDGRIWVGHTGGLPGSITGFFTHRESATTGLVCMNSSVAGRPSAFATTLGAAVLDRQPPIPEPWVPGTEVPTDLAPLVGTWFSEGASFTFGVRQGALEARIAGDQGPPSVFESVGADEFVTASGRERGERLVIRRHPDGSVRQLNWATYRFTREPLAFGEDLPNRSTR